MQSILASLINIIVLGFFVVMVIDFVIGLFVHLRKAETLPKPSVTEQSKSQFIVDPLLDPWDVDEVKVVRKDAHTQSASAQAERATFESVCADFAKQGLTLQRHSGSRYRYKVVNSHGSPCQFKKLQDALDWLATSKQLMSTV